MKQIIQFTKDITFKTNIEEIVSISLDDDLELKGEDLISGNFFIKGTYKKTKADIPCEYSYKIPCEIVISDRYDTYNASIDIDDFNYEINEDILKINVSVLIDNLEEKEENLEREISSFIDKELEKDTIDESFIETENILEKELDERNEEKEPDKIEDPELDKKIEESINIKEDERDISNDVAEVFKESSNILNETTETYLTYKVYTVQEEDTIEGILNKYDISKEDLCNYNNLEEFSKGIKLVIPSSNGKI